MSKPKLPQTDSIEELARFWDTHDLTDFDDELEEVTDSIFVHEDGGILTIRLRPEELDALRRIARAKGVKQIDLVRQWVLEKIRAA